jgi:cytochrome c
MIPLLLTLLAAPQDAGAYDPGRFERTDLAVGFDRPMELAVAPDERVFVVEQGGAVKLHDPRTGAVTVALELEVWAEQENGLLGIALDPDFAANGWVYLMYSPRDHDGQFVSRFTFDGERLDPASERVLLSWLEQRRECCHHGGSLEFGPEGNLFIATGDNTSPFASDGFNPIDERPDRYPFDAQRSAANTMNFAGKVLRIRPTPQGTYTIPPGNLFEDPTVGRPEIYVMGTRNSWRISIDPATGYLYWGDVGPDSSSDGERGPRGYDEFNQAKGPGFFGWPLFIGDNFAYADWDFEHEHLGPRQDPARPLNLSPNNTGARVLPPAQPAWIYYPYADSEEFPGVNPGGGRTACAGPAYRFDGALDSAVKFPPELDGTLLLYEWSRHWVRVARLEGDSELVGLEPFPGGHAFVRPVDLEFGPRGNLFVLEYGTTWGTNEDSRLSRIDYVRGNRAPLARASASRTAGASPLALELSSEGTVDRDGDPLRHAWTLEPGGELLSEEASAKVVVEREGQLTVKLTVTDPEGATGEAYLPLAVGNEPPQLEFALPASGAFYDPALPLEYEVRVTDLEDGESEGDPDLAWWMQNVFVTPRVVAGPAGDEPAVEPPGLAAMKRSDCFNCHAVDTAVVGPALRAVAARARAEGVTPEETASRIRAGSAGRWGDAQMLPHAALTEAELSSIVAWVLALPEAPAGDEVRPRPGHLGRLEPGELRLPEGGGGTLVLEASYTDTGGDAVGPQTGRARLVLRPLAVEAEHASALERTRRIDSESASGGAFQGHMEHGGWLRYDAMDLDGIASVLARVSSAGAGARVELRADGPDGPLVGGFDMEPNGAWEDWFEVELELDWPGGVHDLYVTFRNEGGGGGLMNLDRLTFRRAASSGD